MNALQRRLMTILRTINAPVTATQIRDRCQLPKPVDVIASHLRGLERAGQAREWRPAVWVHRDYSEQATPPVAPATTKREKPMSTKVNGGKPAKQDGAAEQVREELALLSDLQAMADALTPREVVDAHLKITTLEALIKFSSRRVAAMLQRIIDEDLTNSVEA